MYKSETYKITRESSHTIKSARTSKDACPRRTSTCTFERATSTPAQSPTTGCSAVALATAGVSRVCRPTSFPRAVGAASLWDAFPFISRRDVLGIFLSRGPWNLRLFVWPRLRFLVAFFILLSNSFFYILFSFFFFHVSLFFFFL